jgi:hypothetical protein
MRASAGAIYIQRASRREMAAAALVRVLRLGSQEDWQRAVELMAGMSACERAVAWVQFMDRAAKDGSLASAMVLYEQCRFVFDTVLKDVVDARRVCSDTHAVASAADINDTSTTANSSRASSMADGLYYASDDNEGLDFVPSPYVLPPIPRPRPQSAPAHAYQGGPPTIPRGESESLADYARRVSQMHVPRNDMVEPPHVPRVPIPLPPRPPQDDRPPSARVRENMGIVEEDAEDQELPVHQGWRPVPWRGHGV